MTNAERNHDAKIMPSFPFSKLCAWYIPACYLLARTSLLLELWLWPTDICRHKMHQAPTAPSASTSAEFQVSNDDGSTRPRVYCYQTNGSGRTSIKLEHLARP